MADEILKPNDEVKDEVTPTPDEPQVTPEEELARLRVEMAKYKKNMDKAASEAASFKKQLKEKLTADEIALQEKAELESEREEKFQQLLKENTVTKYEKNFLGLGYPQDLATKAATAQFENDTEELFKIQSLYQTNLVKAKEAEWAKNRPNPQTGNGEGEQSDPFLMGFKL